MALSLDGSNGITFPSTSVQGDAGIGYGQTWQNVSGSRTAGTTYTNSTGKPIQIAIQANTSAATVTISGVVFSFSASTSYDMIYLIVPNGATYVYTSAGAPIVWNELR